MRLLAELKRRNVIRMAGLYLVGAWLITQVAATLLPVFGAPEWVMKVLVGLLAVGFLAALVFSWIYELTPDGLKRDGEISAAQSIAPQTARRMDRMLIAFLLAALGYFAIDKFVLAPERIATAPGSTAAPADLSYPADAKADSNANAAAAATDEPEAKPIVRGIAVLPFDNLSPDPDNAFFAGGVYEEVLTKLSRIGELRVISRTSMEQIAKQDLQVGTIGQRLGVSHVLEGSVRKAGDQIRVTVQLIEAASDNHIWAENYDRNLDDVFAIQSEIALAIANQLKLSLSSELQANLSERPTQNQAAYALYLRALEERRSWRGAEGFKAIIELLEPAVAADPDFLQAQVLLAEAYGRMNWTASDADGSYASKARKAVADIVQRWPDHSQSRIAQGQLLYNLDRDYVGALEHFETAREQLPNDVALLMSISGSLKRLGQDEAFLETARRVVELDPESSIASGELMLALWANQRLDEAVKTAERAHERFPQERGARVNLARARLVRMGDLKAVLALAPDSIGGMIARFVEGDIESLLRPLDPGVVPDPLDRLVIGLVQTELLQLAGQDAAAQLGLAAGAQGVSAARARLASTSMPARDKAFTHAFLAYYAALAGESAAAREDLAQAQAFPPSDDRYAFYALLSAAERILGNAEAAWLLIEPYANRPPGLSHGELRAFKPFYDKVYGESPSYRAYVAKMGGEQR